MWVARGRVWQRLGRETEGDGEHLVLTLAAQPFFDRLSRREVFAPDVDVHDRERASELHENRDEIGMSSRCNAGPYER